MTRCMGISSGRSLKVWSSDILRCWRSRILVRLASRAARSSSKKAAEHLIKRTSLNTRHCHIWLTENFYTTNIHIIIILYTKIILYFFSIQFFSFKHHIQYSSQVFVTPRWKTHCGKFMVFHGVCYFLIHTKPWWNTVEIDRRADIGSTPP